MKITAKEAAEKWGEHHYLTLLAKLAEEQGIDIIEDECCPPDRIYFWNKDYLPKKSDTP